MGDGTSGGEAGAGAGPAEEGIGGGGGGVFLSVVAGGCGGWAAEGEAGNVALAYRG